jgi:RecA-family ATPase
MGNKPDWNDRLHEEGAEGVRGRFDEQQGRERGPRFEFKTFNAAAAPVVANYLVKGIIPCAGLTVVWGPPKCGKSFWLFDLMMHVALGWRYRDRRVRQGTVVYLALESG